MAALLTGYYINLDRRTDRQTHFKQNISSIPFFSQLQRLSATQHSDGSIGCGMSHLRALQELQKKLAGGGDEFNYVAIFEDDFCVLNHENLALFLNAFPQVQNSPCWDVIVFTPSGQTIQELANEITDKGFKRIFNNQTATGYILKKHMLPVFIDNFKTALEMMLRGDKKNDCAIDQYWKHLQLQYKFYYYEKIFGGQLPGWSETENRRVNYNARFIRQNEF